MPLRCNDTRQYLRYARLHGNLMNTDDNGIYDITGCLSKCDKYKYSSWPLNDLQNYPAQDSDLPSNTLLLRFIVMSAEYELREQVSYP